MLIINATNIWNFFLDDFLVSGFSSFLPGLVRFTRRFYYDWHIARLPGLPGLDRYIIINLLLNDDVEQLLDGLIIILLLGNLILKFIVVVVVIIFTLTYCIYRKTHFNILWKTHIYIFPLKRKHQKNNKKWTCSQLQYQF